MLGLRQPKTRLIVQKCFYSSGAPTHMNVQNGIAKIVMCDQKTRNSLSISMMDHLINNISETSADKSTRVIIIGAEGPIFSAGHNLKELSPEHGKAQQNKVFSLAATLMTKIIDCPVPVIARVDGLAAAAGCQLVAQCDLAFCTEKSTFSTPGANFGIFCSTPGIALARTVPKTTALKMLLTGQPISSHEAEMRGLITKVCSDLDGEIAAVCGAIMGKSRSVIELGKRFYYEQVNAEVKKAYEMGGRKMVENLQIEDGQEGIRSFIEKRKPQWTH
ncbi:enoyl-CoA hydratase domain-containing protein 3, mitochondrial [Tribolium castaneum]|uniref:Enoyl-CoA hydratase domain-containing protein 3, mitochondrial n=1 Tax=Tribolium castaneum TaxID=7070 RepID=D6WVS2_TRICA|nr:PREDICTED: enoyl-CoA hydratase domain-containing protein 3, mitochondrial [Tribolium castaneum]EFA08608.2 Enoyl-CoA hydratase domain-containing protein 3, mitochondrial-like Protein [Tribolium castaneum]|eukprot:XP_015837983.1 PREDICTED: enoyl-CoA hydratase domain-containing protein 3, mitochondrial [Tribolium castaneum]